MTWGMIESTPLLISGSGDVEGAPSFKLPPTPRRDVIAHEMGKSAAKSLRQRVSNNSKSVIRKAQSPAIGTPADRARLLSPAARTFMQKNRLGTPVMSPLQQAARTPFGGTPRGARDATPRAGMGVRQDPKISGGASAAGGKAAEDSSITDHLLDLGGRR
jgi:protein DGCR14